ncbi:hypothetical protein EMMF5_001670 [Cystobasidiomycetes sp. EMM_F5]
MAKSLRSKSKMAFRRKKRTDPKSEYAMRDAIRTSRLSEKLKVLKAVERSDDEDFVDESGGEDMEDAGDENAQTATTSEQSANATPSTSTSEQPNEVQMQDIKQSDKEAKITTGGERSSAKAIWRKKHGIAGKHRTHKNSTTHTGPNTFRSVARMKKQGKR